MKFKDEFIKLYSKNITEIDLIEEIDILIDELDSFIINEGEQSKSIQCDIARDNVKYYRKAMFDIKDGLKKCKKIKDITTKFQCNNQLNDLLKQIQYEVNNQMDIISNTCMSHRILKGLGRGLSKLGKTISRALD